MLICSHQHLRGTKWVDKRKHPVNVNVWNGQVHVFPPMCMLLCSSQSMFTIKSAPNWTSYPPFQFLTARFLQITGWNMLHFFTYCLVLPLSGLNFNGATRSLSKLWLLKWLGTPYSLSKQPCWGYSLCVCSSIVGGKHHITVTLTADI